MATLRSIEQIIAPPAPHWVGDAFRVHNFFPSTPGWPLQRMSPFFLMDYGSKIEFPPTDTPRGVGVHPHRGFETVTIAYYGKVAHHDSAGNSGIIGEGDVQWMTAASGVLHKEYQENEWSKKGGLFQMVQLWVNLPAIFKSNNPKYQAIKREKYGQFILPNAQGIVEVIAGNYKGAIGAASSFTPIEMYNIRIKKGAELDFSLPQHYNTGCLVVEGNCKFNNTPTPTDHFVLFKNDGLDFKLEATDDAIILLVSGEPINEPIVPYGPFLMNTKEEILKAYDDFKNGKFGYLKD